MRPRQIAKIVALGGTDPPEVRIAVARGFAVGEELLRRGATIDRYEVRELIGQGGMGEVYRAWDTVLQRDVAVKVLRLRDEEMLKRFEREAEAIGKVDSENVVQIHDFRLQGEYPYIVMEFLRGVSLRERISKSGAMSIEDAVGVVLGVCRGVAACHRLGIIHRDLKPANVFLAETAHYGTVVKVLDFGVAKPRHYTVDVTGPGKIAGTPAYVAPELLRGMEADELSDQYGIGLLLHVGLTGKPPFGSKERKDLGFAILRSAFLPPKEARPDLPEELVAILLRALNAERAARFPSVMAFARALVPFASGEEQEIGGPFFDEDGRAKRQSAVTTVIQKVTPEPTGPSDAAAAAEQVVPTVGRNEHVVVPIAPLEEGHRRDWGEIPHALSATQVDSSMVPGRSHAQSMHVGGVVDSGKRRAARGRLASKATVWALLSTAAVLAVVFVVIFVQGPRLGEVQVEPAVDERGDGKLLRLKPAASVAHLVGEATASEIGDGRDGGLASPLQGPAMSGQRKTAHPAGDASEAVSVGPRANRPLRGYSRSTKRLEEDPSVRRQGRGRLQPGRHGSSGLW